MAIFQNSIDYRGPGDVNADGVVDWKDIDAVILAFGQHKTPPPTPQFDQRCDMNYDDIINWKDIYFVIRHFTSHYDC